MNNIEQYNDLIEKFLAGDMTFEEETYFRTELKLNPELREQAKVVSSLIMGIKRKKLKEDKAVVSNSIIQKKKKVATSMPIKKNKIIKLIILPLSAAAICILLFNIFSSGHSDNLIIFDSNYCEYNYEHIARGNEDSLVIKELMTLFNGLQTCDDCTEIIYSLENIYSSVDTEYRYRPYANDIAWYLALAYIKDDKIKEAEKVLKKLITDNPETSISDRCTELLKKIKELED